jgi:hypothetical protein
LRFSGVTKREEAAREVDLLPIDPFHFYPLYHIIALIWYSVVFHAMRSACNLKKIARMGETLAQDVAMPEPFFGPTQLPLDLLHVKTTNIFEFDPFDQASPERKLHVISKPKTRSYYQQ